MPIGAISVNASWRSIETSPGVYDFSQIDARVASAESRGAKVLINLSGTPEFWASKPTQVALGGLGSASMTKDVGAWSNFVTAIANHFGDRVEYLPWNEPCVIGFWTGTKAQLVQLQSIAYTKIKAMAPTATVVAPACPVRLSSQKTYFKALYGTAFGGKKFGLWADKVAVNPYPLSAQGPESALTNYNWFKTMAAGKGIKKPIYVTEINYGVNGISSATALSDAMQQSYLLRTQALLAGAGAQRMVWFAWDLLHVSVHLTPFFGTGRFVDLTPAGQSWQVGYSWLNNTSVDKCVKNSAGVYSCVARGGGEVRRIYWRVSGTSTVAAPATSFSKEDVNGTPTAITPGTKLTITTSPIMVRATA